MRTYCSAFLAVAILCAVPLQAADRSVEPIISHIPRETVESTALASIGYSRRLHALEIQFRDGLTYRYLAVPPAVYRSLLTAESKAHFYNQHIRGRYHCLRVRAKHAR